MSNYLHTEDWKRQRRAVWRRCTNDGETRCEHCGKLCETVVNAGGGVTTKNFEVHHLDYDHNVPGKPEDLSRLKGLCSAPPDRNCHDYYHRRCSQPGSAE